MSAPPIPPRAPASKGTSIITMNVWRAPDGRLIDRLMTCPLTPCQSRVSSSTDRAWPLRVLPPPDLRASAQSVSRLFLEACATTFQRMPGSARPSAPHDDLSVTLVASGGLVLT